MYLRTPGVVAGLETVHVENTEFEPYCNKVKELIHNITTTRGSMSECTSMYGYEYRYADEQFKLRYIDSDYGNDQYYVEVNRRVWDELPAHVNPFMVNENGAWNFCFHLQDSPDKTVLLFHLPGRWLEELEKLE